MVMVDNRTNSPHIKGEQQTIQELLTRTLIADGNSLGTVMIEQEETNGRDLETEKKVSQKHPYLETNILIWSRVGQKTQG